MSVVARLGDFAAGVKVEELPTRIVERARTALFNGYGVALGSLDTPYAPVAGAAVLLTDGERVDDSAATLLGDGRRTSIGGAAFANAALFHGRTQEDTCGSTHIGPVIIPLLTALIEARRAAPADLLPAMVAGYEVGGLLDAALASATTPRGLRGSALYGCAAAAAAAARALRLDAVRTASAIANACAFAGGTLQAFIEGTDEWRYQVGVAARNGLAAASLAREGSVSAARAIEGAAGYARAFADRDVEESALTERLGRDWALDRLTFKRYPVCAFNQTPVAVALALRDQIAGRRIRSFTLRMNPYEAAYAGINTKGPFSSIAGTLMSAPFCVAAALVRGAPTLGMLRAFDDAAVMQVVSASKLEEDPGIQSLSCAITVVLEDGSSIEQLRTATPQDYAFSRAEVSTLVYGIGRELGISAGAIVRLEKFVDALPDAPIEDVLTAFAEARARNYRVSTHCVQEQY